MQTSLGAISSKAKKEKKYRFRNLYRLLNEEILHDSWRMLNKNSAAGIDRVDYDEYNKNLDENIQNLVERLKQKKYRAKLVKRKYIDKGNGKQRPLGIPATEDKLVQHAVSRILSAIYEQDFYPCSYGYRPNRNAHRAIKDLRTALETKLYRYVVEADIKGYFDNMDHDWLVTMLEQRVNDRAFIRLIKKWLKAGVLESDGQVIRPKSGSPQGGVISPILANIYMHYALVMWFERVVKPHCHGRAEVFVYADDFICIFSHQKDAQRFYRVLGKRLEKFKLSLSPEKTHIIDFRLVCKNSFDFLGFTFHWNKARWKNLKIRTSKKRFQRSYYVFNMWLKTNRSLKMRILIEKLNRKLRGYYNYYGIKGNSESINKLYHIIEKQLYKWVNRRSQRKSYTWKGFQAAIKYFGIAYPRIVWK